jgi:hypothetical protein
VNLDHTPGPLADGRADWRPPDVRDDPALEHTLSPAEVATLERTLARSLASGIALDDLDASHFPLPGFEPLFERLRRELETGRGMFLLRGFPVDRHSKDALRHLYVGFSRHLGPTLAQSRGGDHLGDVRNLNVDVNSPRGRAYTSKQKLTFHADQADVVGLLVLRVAKAGGLSMLASALAIRNEIARTRSDLLHVLHQPIGWSWQEQQPTGASGWYSQPIYTERDGRFSSCYIRTHIVSAQRFEAVPRLTPLQIEAMDLIDRLAHSPEFHIAAMFQPGDLQFLNNHVILHSRTAFEDHDEPDRQRHLLRIWLAVRNSRPLHESRRAFYREVAPGALRGGYTARDGRRVYETTAAMT